MTQKKASSESEHTPDIEVFANEVRSILGHDRFMVMTQQWGADMDGYNGCKIWLIDKGFHIPRTSECATKEKCLALLQLEAR